MLPEVGFSELLVLALVVLLVMKPEDFPMVMHKLGVWAAQLQLYVRGMSMGWQEASQMAKNSEIAPKESVISPKEGVTSPKQTERRRSTSSGSLGKGKGRGA